MILHGDAAHLPLASGSVHCIVTSPPYNVGIDYDGYDDRLPWGVYWGRALAAAREMYRVLVPGGRLWLNVMPAVPVEGEPYRVPLSMYWQSTLEAAGFRYRDTVAWIQDSHDGQCAWGSYLMPSAPNLRGGFEVVLSVFKGDWRRETAPEFKGWRDNIADADGKSDWPDLCRNVWKIPPARKAPAFPDELPRRCIRLSTWPGETVLDPYAGTGTTVRVAEELGRVGLGFDITAPRGEEEGEAA